MNDITIRTAEAVAKDNDLLRRLLIPTPRSRVILTESIFSSPYQMEILKAVKDFKDFNIDSDPYGEHDYASFRVRGEVYCFKIDYYDENFEFGVDPYEEKTLCRVITIMRPEER
jgi:hypothetical protein